MSRIYLSRKHGVNPMLMNCFWCREPKGVALIGQPNASVRRALAAAGAPRRS